MSAVQNRSSIILLDASQNSQVVVTPEDKDKFCLTVQQAIQACQASDNAYRFGEQFKSLLERLSDWIAMRKRQIHTAAVTVRHSDILFYVMQSQVQRDADLVGDLTDLDIEIANSDEFDLIELNVMSVPFVSEGSSEAFLSSGQVFTYAK